MFHSNLYSDSEHRRLPTEWGHGTRCHFLDHLLAQLEWGIGRTKVARIEEFQFINKITIKLKATQR